MKEVGQGPCIDRYFLRSKSNQSSEVQQQDKKQSLQDINPPISEEEEPSTAEPLEPSLPQLGTEAKILGRKPLIKWPKSREKKMWGSVNTDVSKVLEQLRGTAIKKLEKMGKLIYNYGAEHFGITEERKTSTTIPTKSMRQQETERLVKERRLLKKQWRKAREEEKEGINLLQAEITSRLSNLRRAENLKRRRKRKEHARSSFFKDPFTFVKSLFTKEKKSGKLKTSRKDLEAHLKRTHTDSHRGEQCRLPSDMPPIHPPEHQLDVDPPKWREVERTVH